MRPVPPVNVVVAATAPDIQAEGIAGAIAGREDMTLVSGRVLAVHETDALLESHAVTGRCGIVLVGPDADTEEPAERYLAKSAEHVVIRVTAPIGDIVRVATHRAGLQELLTVLRSLVDQAGVTPSEREPQHALHREARERHAETKHLPPSAGSPHGRPFGWDDLL
jgi:hypothetical protein